jgi:hypothetical protein
MVGYGNVDNTSDATNPTQLETNGIKSKSTLNSPTFTGSPLGTNSNRGEFLMDFK